MGSSKGSKAPAVPDPYQTSSTESQFNRLDTYSPSGSGTRYGYTDPTTGKFVQGVAPKGAQSAVSTQESQWEKSIREALQPASVDLTNRVIGDNITNMPDAPRVQDRGTVAKSIYDRTLSMLQPDIEKNNSRLITNLQARGIPVGAEAFNDAVGSQQRNTEDTLARLAMDADVAGGQEQSRQFGLDSSARQQSISELIAAMGGNYNPPSAEPSGNAAGTNYSGNVSSAYQSQLNAYNQQQQQKSSTAGALGSLAGGMLMKSDRRLKRDITPLGLRGAFMLYQYRYAWDAPGTIRRGFMAQEVLRTLPQAVIKAAGGWLALDYSLLPEVS